MQRPSHLTEDSIEYQDNVQVVEYDRNASQLEIQRQVLAKLCKQLAEYYTKRNIKPGEPQDWIRSSIRSAFDGSAVQMNSSRVSDAYFIERFARFVQSCAAAGISDSKVNDTLKNRPCYS